MSAANVSKIEFSTNRGGRIELPVTASNLTEVLASLTEGQLLLTLSGLFPTAPSTMTDDDAAQIARACFGLDSYFVRETDVCAVGALFRGSLRVADASTALRRRPCRPPRTAS